MNGCVYVCVCEFLKLRYFRTNQLHIGALPIPNTFSYLEKISLPGCINEDLYQKISINSDGHRQCKQYSGHDSVGDSIEIASLVVLASDSVLDWHQYLSEKALLLTY